MVVPSKNQQNELWIFLVLTWWIGSLVAWIAAWTTSTTSTANDSLLTASGLLLFCVSAALRLPVVTSTQPTTSLEDHFVWLVTASANVNWLGYLCLSAQSYLAVLPAGAIGILVEYWLWNEMSRDCLTGLRDFLVALREKYLKTPETPLGSQSSLEKTASETCKNEPSALTLGSQAIHAAIGETQNTGNSDVIGSASQAFGDGLDAAESTVIRTCEDGIDPAGFRYLAGEIQVAWEDSQRAQTVLIGFVPAFHGQPEVELELDCEECSAQIQNCTPSGLRIQLKRTPRSNSQLTNLSWYAKESNCDEPTSGESAESKPQTLA